MAAMEARQNLSIYHLVRFPEGYSPEGSQAAYPAILALHGHGSNERDLIGLAEAIPENLLWISGRGPVRFAPDGYDWYPVTQFGKPDPALLDEALDRLNGFITEILSVYPIDPDRLFLMGFSQGSMDFYGLPVEISTAHPGRDCSIRVSSCGKHFAHG